MADEVKQKIIEASSKHPKADQKFQYGTAGFRMKATLLPSVVFRVGLLAALRSRKMQGRTIGVMITASHNVYTDNGVKLVDPMGEMLEASWEEYATQLANAESDAEVAELYHSLSAKFNLKPDTPAHVIYGKDTRESGPGLVAALADALISVGAKSEDYGLVTTPQLHYLTRCLNTAGTRESYGVPTQEGYYNKLATAYKALMKGKQSPGKVTVDCANGVGAPKLKALTDVIGDTIEVDIINDNIATFSVLNSECGADYVKTGQRLPPATKNPIPNSRYASFDGDADRIVYYYVDDSKVFHLLDGDKIATLVASFIVDLVKASGITTIKVGVVQTAYANGASTNYITSRLNLPVVCTATGVKHLHHAATKFDCGVYFEANGHGTVLFSGSANDTIHQHEPQSPAQKTALDSLKSLTELINQTVGDALSDLLLVEVVLAHKAWTPKEWDICYTDLPNRLKRVVVADRNIYKTTDAERKLVSPEGLQAKIDEEVAKYEKGRSFARASGTEDAVRVYAEASSHAEVEELAGRISDLIL